MIAVGCCPSGCAGRWFLGDLQRIELSDAPLGAREGTMSGREIVVVGWFEDAIKALIERPWPFLVVFRICMGKHAFREFYGAMTELYRQREYLFDVGYCLDGGSWHEDKLPFVWWKERNMPSAPKERRDATRPGGLNEF